MKVSDGQSEFSRVFNFAIIGYSRNSRKLDAHEKLVFYSSLMQWILNIKLAQYLYLYLCNCCVRCLYCCFQYCCLVETCSDCFWSHSERTNHMVTAHKYPSAFRFVKCRWVPLIAQEMSCEMIDEHYLIYGFKFTVNRLELPYHTKVMDTSWQLLRPVF